MTKKTVLEVLHAPNPVGLTLNEAQIEQIAHTVYNRFVKREGSPCWKSAFIGETKPQLIRMVKSVVDSMVINNFEITNETV